VKFRRRQVLLGGVALGSGLTAAQNYQANRRQGELQALARQQLAQTDQAGLLKATFEADAQKIYQGQAIMDGLKLAPPQITYDRDISTLLIRCSKIATQQYLTGKTLPDYDGAIRDLPAFTPELKEFKQIASFRGKEAKSTEKVEVNLPENETGDPLDSSVGNAEDEVRQTLQKAVKLTQEIPVYLGFILASPRMNIIVFRGTQTTIEWLNNLYARQIPFTDRQSGQYFGKIHEGFINNYLRIVEPIPRIIAQELNPAVPCYVTGHSLGAALAVLCALDLAVNIPNLAPRLQLYSYACPRVGDPTFARFHAQHVPNSYRVVNLADAIPILPPTEGFGTYVHVGQVWSFLSQQNDFLPNHVVDTYQAAVQRRVETDQARGFPVSGLG
jgi:triacylglycerol lipase